MSAVTYISFWNDHSVFLVGSGTLGFPSVDGLLHREMRVLCCGVVAYVFVDRRML
jgi:hypothetical protein